jgi:hypothetical protein
MHRVIYCNGGIDNPHLLVCEREPQAALALHRHLRRQGRTVWIEDEQGRHVPAKGSMSNPAPHYATWPRVVSESADASP